jgi:hypothetical protein
MTAMKKRDIMRPVLYTCYMHEVTVRVILFYGSQRCTGIINNKTVTAISHCAIF